MIELILIALSLSIDALGIGFSYGMRRIQVAPAAKLIIFLIAALTTGLSIGAGNAVAMVLGPDFGGYIGVATLILLGSWVIVQGFLPEKEKKADLKSRQKAINIIIKSLGITIRIIREPQSIDMDSNSVIEPKEAFYLGFALSLDSMGAGIAIGAMGTGVLFLPLLSGAFQVAFLGAGLSLGLKLAGPGKGNRVWNIISGFLLIFIGVLRLI